MEDNKPKTKAHRELYRIVMDETYDQDYINMLGGIKKFNEHIKQARMSRRKTAKPIEFPPRKEGNSATWDYVTPFIVQRYVKEDKSIYLRFAVTFNSYCFEDAMYAAEQIAREFKKDKYTMDMCRWESVNHFPIDNIL